MPRAEVAAIALDTWERALRHFSDEQIGEAMQKCINPFFPYIDNPPTLGQFMRLCLPSIEEMGFPTAEEAYHQTTLPNEERHPLVQKTISYINEYTFKLMAAKDARKSFLDTYNLLLKRELKTIAKIKMLPEEI